MHILAFFIEMSVFHIHIFSLCELMFLCFVAVYILCLISVYNCHGVIHMQFVLMHICGRVLEMPT